MAFALSVFMLFGTPSPAQAIPSLGVTSTTTTSVRAKVATALAGLAVTAPDPATALQVILSTDLGTLELTPNDGLTLDYANQWAGDRSISFQGTGTDINAALASAKLTPGNAAGQIAHISITGLETQAGHIYSPSNQHFYEYVASPGTSWDQASANAGTHTFLGQTGYLATMPSAQINDLVAHRIQGASNVWFGARSTDSFSASIKRTWAWTGGPLAGQPFSYCTNVGGGCNFNPGSGRYSSWFGGEPNNYGVTYSSFFGRYNNYSGEWVAVTNWGGSFGAWNDLKPSAGTSGYVIEYGDQVNGGNFNGVAAETSSVAVVDVPSAPANVTAARGDTESSVTFSASVSNGSPITGYTVTAHSDGDEVTMACPESPCLFTGLTNGTAYTFTVRATNGVGDSLESNPSASVTPATVPGAPTNVVAVGGPSRATITFSAPASNGGASITGYTATSIPEGRTATCPSSPCTVTGLTNGSPYTFTVHATNAVGNSVESGSTNSVTPLSVPDAPTGVAAVRHNRSAVVSFTESAYNGGSAVTGYTATSTPGGRTASCSTSPCLVTGLTNGVSYTFTVHATNVVGNSDESAPSNAVIPATRPGAPTGATAARGDKSATITFTAPVSDGSSAITGYTVTVLPGGITHPCVGSPCTVTGLANGTSYTFTVHATNAVGNSPESAPTTVVVPGPPPNAPTGVTAARGDRSASVTFSAPSDSTVTGYTVTSTSGGHTASCPTSPCLVEGLTNGTSYTFTVHATNDVGNSAESAPSNAVIPAAVPDAPTGVTALRGNTTASVQFTAPSGNGSAVTGYTVISSPLGGVSATCEASPCAVTGLTNGQAYTFTVTATNAVGTGIASEPSNSVTPATVPNAPTSVSAVRHNLSAEVSFTAPADNGGTEVTSYTVTSSPGEKTVTCDNSPCTVEGLTNGTAYTFTVVATNAVGPSAESAPSEAVTPARTPNAPTEVSAIRGNASASVRFTAPADNGSTITGYTLTASSEDDDLTMECPESPCLFIGLTNGTAYTFTVIATNDVGPSAASEPSEAVTPASKPGVPTDLVAQRGNTSATITFTAPVDDGGSAITGYTVTSEPGDVEHPCVSPEQPGPAVSTGPIGVGVGVGVSGGPCLVEGLTNGTSYTFTVHATNAVGDSDESAASNSVIPATVPDAPTGVSAVRHDKSATVSFTAPVANGSSAITGYTVTAHLRDAVLTKKCSSPCLFDGLTNGEPYTFTVHATNAVGNSPESVASDPVTPATVPNAPTDVSAVRGDETAEVSFTAPVDNGGTEVTSYTVTSSPGEHTATCEDSPCTVENLTNGSPYTFTVIATNDVGDSAESSPSEAVTPARTPNAPTRVSAVRGNASASVSFTAPADNGSTITGYTITTLPGDTTTDCKLQNPCLVTGLTNGQAYTFTVIATNDVGPSAASEPSEAVTPATAPGAPTNVAAVRGNKSATITFTAPDDNGGSTVTGYTATSTPGGKTGTCEANPCTVEGLTNGTSYTFTVHATNAVDSSVESDPSNSVTPLSVPGAPTGVSAVRHNLSAEVFFTAPADNGGTAVTGYTVTSTPGDKTRHCLSSPCTVEGLANGTPYTFTVVATNAVGDSIASEPSSSVTPATVPNAPTGVSAVRGPGSAAISFTAPTDNGGSQVTNYTVTSSPDGHSATCEDSPCTVEGLTNGTPYTFTVIATNAVGDSTRSAASDPVTPATVPSAPTEVSATGGNTTAVARFTASADNGGAAITSYVVTSSPGGVLHACPSGSPCTITGLTNGIAYTFTVHATNDVGPSAESAPSSAVTPMTKPSAPTDVAATRGDHSATVTFTVPADGGSEITGYTVTTQPGGATKSCSGPTTCTVTSLTNGTSYTFTVHATNEVGDSPESAPSAAVVPATTPRAPTAVTATRGDRAAVVTFTAPADNGGSAITGYTVSTQPDTGAHACVASPCTVTGLTNGIAYTFTVQATNAVGSSSESDASAAVTPATTPGRPTQVVATPGNGSASIAFSAPSTGGLAITSYTATSVPDGLTGTCQTSPCVVEGLSNGISYTFTVYATNEVGPSLDSTPSVPVTPATVPGEPLDLEVVRGPNSATFTFLAPDTDGGASVTKYQVSTDRGDTWATLPTSGTDPITATLRGLTNGTPYEFQVRAVNRVGGGPAATYDPVTPAARPDAPTGVTGVIGDRQVTVAWITPSSNGAPITGYTVTSYPGATTKSCTGSPCVVTGLDNGTAYRFSVVATNDVGDSLPSARSTAVTPATTPGAPTLLKVTSLAKAVSVDFSAPTTTGGSPVTGYQISTDGGTTWGPLTVTDSTPIHGLLVGLTNGTTYTIKVRAVNGVGGGTASAGLSVKPASTPSAPRNVTATADRTRVTVSWTVPTTTGGSPITGYVVTANPGRQTCSTTTTSCVFPALPVGTYTFSVAAINTAPNLTGTGTGPAATSASLRVTSRPGVPRALTVTPGDRTLALTFQPPASNGGSAITGYYYTADGAKTWHRLTTTGTTTLKATVAPVLNGTSFSVAVLAANANGWSPATPLVTVRTVAWFRDPLTPTQRQQEIAVPKDPTTYRGPLRNTKAAYRSKNGTIAYPASALNGRQLQPTQGVNVLFGFDSSTLTTAGKAQMKAVATSLKYVTAVTCEGYADYSGSAAHELDLSRTRANAVCAAIHTYAPQVTSRTVVAYGRTYPVIVGGTSSQRGGNRRVVILVTR